MAASLGASASAPGNPAKPDRVLPLSSSSGVYVPPRGESFMKFSFDFPEPSVEFAGLQFSFRVYTFENTYALDREQMTVEDKSDGLEVSCSGFVWAGGQEKAPGRLRARFHKNGTFIEWDARIEMEQPVKSIAAIVRGVPRGKISAGGQRFFDPKDDELLFGYPFGGGALFIARGLNTPLLVIQQGDNEFFFLSALNQAVRANRFYLQPGERSYRAELVYEREGWKKSNTLESPVWRAGAVASQEAAFQPHFKHVERAFNIPDWEKREDVPDWLRNVALAVSLHGMHWTGYIFNDYAKMQTILRWVASQIPAARVLVFIAAWDGRYYWNYPLYQPEPRLGGEAGFKALLETGRQMGFHMMPMFGINSANERLPEFSKFADATTAQIDGDPFYLNWVDWDNDRHMEGWMPYMNVGVGSWREWLVSRIDDVLSRYPADAYFLDIAGGWENNTKADTHVGTQQLVADLARKHPGVLCCGEMHYDALMSFISLYHAFSEFVYPAAVTKYARFFQHLSHPAPGRGSSGVHESGFSKFDPETLSLNELAIPTLTVVDDTFERYQNVMAQIIARAKHRAGIA
ncbi:MAG: hypothetical protein LAO04_08640 [Acidobacteriia bacterium]|nr:hypothetical protein [Terriglobia bacterium]